MALRENLGKFSLPSPKDITYGRKVVYFPDKEVKVRVVAILDYYSQTVLRPLHSYLFRVLKKIPQDCTFSQGGFKEHLKSWKRYHSVDLTAATDRFPITVIQMVLESKLPTKYVNAWRDIMVKFPFKLQGSEKYISYNTGNPMGAYSSWPSFAVAHHFLIYHCCRSIGMEWKTAPYFLLGDDILIGDDTLAEAYLD